MRGDVNGCCEGKNVWDEAMRTFILRILNISVVSWDNHHLDSIEKLRLALDKKFEYEFSIVGFENMVKRWLKIDINCRNPTLGPSVKMQLTLPKVGKWSPSKIPKTQKTI